jgi:hypothetical protein
VVYGTGYSHRPPYRRSRDRRRGSVYKDSFRSAKKYLAPSHSGGSHAGRVHEDGRARSRWTPAGRLTLVPIETLGPAARRMGFAVVPPWRKPVYHDPEDQGT